MTAVNGRISQAWDAGVRPTSRTKICIALPGLPAAIAAFACSIAPAPGRRAGRDRGLDKHRTGEHGGCSHKSLQNHHHPEECPATTIGSPSNVASARTSSTSLAME